MAEAAIDPNYVGFEDWGAGDGFRSFIQPMEGPGANVELPNSNGKGDKKVPLSLCQTNNPGHSLDGSMDGSLENGNALSESHAEGEMSNSQVLTEEISNPTLTSTPVSTAKISSSTCGYNSAREQVRFTDSCKEGDDSPHGSAADLVETRLRASSNYEILDPSEISVPIRGFEIMEQRARFTVFKIQVYLSSHDSWYVFRRYTDFVQLNDKLVELFPGFRLALPPKKWFGDNFDPNFLEDRQLGLQAFISNITGHKDICNSKPVREFFCFDDPPGPHDSLEESRALCEALEEQLYNVRKVVKEKDVDIGLLTDERDMYKALVESLQSSLRIQRTLNKTGEALASPQSSDMSLAECDQSQVSNEESSAKEGVNSEDVRSQKAEGGPCMSAGVETVSMPTHD